MQEKCQECNENVSKYKCPRCGVKTCSLPCVKAHKAKADCNGQRDKTAFVATRDFTDINLLSDYRFLEDAGRKTNSTTRDPLRKRHFKPNFLKELEKQAGKRQIDLRIMPYPMSRRKNNFTTYNFKLRSILWHIEWQFPQSSLVLVDKRIEETKPLESILENHMGIDADPIVKHKLKPYIEAGKQKWGLFMKRENMAEKRYHKLNMADTMTTSLHCKTLIEYPVIHVVLESHWSEYNTEGDETTEPTQNSEENNVTSKKTDKIHSTPTDMIPISV